MAAEERARSAEFDCCLPVSAAEERTEATLAPMNVALNMTKGSPAIHWCDSKAPSGSSALLEIGCHLEIGVQQVRQGR